MSYHRKGYSLLVVMVLLALGGFGLQQLAKNGHFAHLMLLEQKVRQNQILDETKASLLGFAGSQGIHSQSHLGHLPCPADLPDQAPKTTCLNKPWGYLPARSSFSINYLNLGLNARHNEGETSAQHHWHYAVSAQLLQANALGWSRWVDYTQPSIQVRIKTENNRIHSGIAAVVATKIEPIDAHQYEISGPHLLISVRELQHQMTEVQKHQIRDTVTSWGQISASTGQTIAPNENLTPNAGAINNLKPVDSNCSCRCTRTRCTCQCDQNAQWISSGPCVGSNPGCLEHSTHTECSSSLEVACVMGGPSQLKSHWPVSRFEPVAAANKSCRPVSRHECPLTTDSTPCICDFSWPDNVKEDLAKFQVNVGPDSRLTVRHVQP